MHSASDFLHVGFLLAQDCHKIWRKANWHRCNLFENSRVIKPLGGSAEISARQILAPKLVRYIDATQICCRDLMNRPVWLVDQGARPPVSKPVPFPYTLPSLTSSLMTLVSFGLQSLNCKSFELAGNIAKASNFVCYWWNWYIADNLDTAEINILLRGNSNTFLIPIAGLSKDWLLLRMAGCQETTKSLGSMMCSIEENWTSVIVKNYNLAKSKLVTETYRCFLK